MGDVCGKLSTIKSSCMEFKGNEITDNKTLIKKFNTFCKEAHVFQVSCQAAYAWPRWKVSEDIVTPMQQVHGFTVGGLMWVDRTADARNKCSESDNAVFLEAKEKKVKKDK